MSAEHDTIEMCGDDDSGSGGRGSATGFGWLIIVDETLRSWFYHLGEAIGKEPGYFLIVPLLLTALCGTGFQVHLLLTNPLRNGLRGSELAKMGLMAQDM